MKILYFARLRQVIGRGQDDIDIPAEVETVSALIDYLKDRDDGIAAAFADLRTLKVAVNQSHASLDASLAGATEVAFFPAGHGRLMRLNVYLQKAGVGSRREAERMVAEGRVKINGTVAIATTPAEEGDVITVDGKPVAPATKPLPRLFVLNKPLDVLVTHRDHKGRRTIFDLTSMNAPGLPRLMNVGRLDVNSEGLLLLSSDGPLAQALMSPETSLSRIYRVRVRGRLKPEDIAALADGIVVDGVNYRGAEFVEEYDSGGRSNTWYRVALTEGKNREIRKLMEHFGCVVNRLIRVQYGPFYLGKLQSGALEEIEPARVAELLKYLGQRGVGL